jgi:capsular exopolysaccharide synthesis family protein
MSRLYEALKEASRRRGTRTGGGDGLWEYWQNSGVEIPPVDSGFHVLPQTELAPTNGHSAEPPADGVSPLGEKQIPGAVEGAVEGPVEGAVEESAPVDSLGADSPTTDARLDHSARLIPYAIDSAVVEHYRRLRAKILQQQEAKPFRTLVVTSAGPQEGKTVTVLNLGLSFSTLPSFRVLVIDGDMRRGTLGNWLGVSPDQPGLSNLFEGSATLHDVVLKSDRIPVHFMVRGNAQVHDLHPSHFANHFRKLGEAFDLVLVDSPPVNLLADVQLLAANTDAVLLVARAFSTSRKSFEKAVQELTPFRLIGAVLNAGVTQRSGGYYGYY